MMKHTLHFFAPKFLVGMAVATSAVTGTATPAHPAPQPVASDTAPTTTVAITTLAPSIVSAAGAASDPPGSVYENNDALGPQATQGLLEAAVALALVGLLLAGERQMRGITARVWG